MTDVDHYFTLRKPCVAALRSDRHQIGLTDRHHRNAHQMLESLHHFDASTYSKLMALSTDFASEGKLYRYFASEFQLNAREMAQMAGLVKEAAAIMKATCRRGELRFDLLNRAELLKNQGLVRNRMQACENTQ